jgi:LuxR family maltose regulon positive regulatory protein
MPVPLLVTKFYIPRARAEAVARPRLVEKLLEGVSRPGSFTLLSGPAGSGKTTLLSEFVTRLQQPVACLSLDEGDDDPVRFWTYLIMACQATLEGVGESALEALETAQGLSDDAVPSILINDLTTQDRAFVLVLDDYHTIQTLPIQAGLQFLLDHLPHNLHLVISTRTDPPWPLARFRARNQLIEIRAQDLRFSVEEAAEFLNRTMELNLADEEVTALEERTEGWIAGLQLAAIALQSLVAMQGRSDIPAFVKAFKGSHLYVAEYLVEEVLQHQHDDVRNFLLETSILKRMNVELCEAVVETLERSNVPTFQRSNDILRRLEQANLFLTPMDDEGRWFRYHHLFADLLQARLQKAFPKDEIAALHLRAATWYEQNGYMVEAVQHTFSAGDYEKAALLVDQLGQTMLFTDRHNMLNNWLDALPNEMIQSHPRLQIYRLLIDLSKGTLDMFEKTLLEKEKLIKALPPSPQNDRLRGIAMVHLSLFFAFQNTFRAIQIAQEALDEVPEGDLKMRAYLYSAFYRAYGMEGDVEKAAQAYRESFRLAEAAGQYGMISNTTMIRAFDLCQYGRLDEAARYCQLVINAGPRIKQKVFYPTGPSYIGLAGIYLERNDLEKAGEYLARGLELCHQGAMHGLFTGYVQKSRLLQAKGELEESLKVFLSLEQTFKRREFTLMARQVSIRLAIGDLAGASNLAPALLEILGESSYAQQLPLIAAESFKLSLARIYIAQEEIDKANQLLDEIQITVEPGMRYGRLMEVYLLRALALQKSDSGIIPADAVTNLERALDLAEAPGFVVLLLEEGPALIPLLNAVVAHQTAPGRIKRYARKLLNAFGEIGKPAALRSAVKSMALVEQLTRREMEVLELLAAGDSNQTIAEKLFITVRTVKKHTSNIYGKLNTSSRTQAVARARKLGLLPAD